MSQPSSLLSVKQTDSAWSSRLFARDTFWKVVHLMREFLEMGARCQLRPTTMIWLQYFWWLKILKVLQDAVIYVIIWVGPPKSWNSGCNSFRVARASLNCWWSDQRNWWQLVDFSAFQDQTDVPLGITIAQLLKQLSQNQNIFLHFVVGFLFVC